LQRDARLGAVKRLKLRLLVSAQHHDPLRWTEVKPNDLGDLFLEHRIVRNLEPVGDTRLEICLCPFSRKSIPRIDY